MYPSQLLGKMALRTKAVQFPGGIDRSFISHPVTILAATESHVVVQYEGSMSAMMHDPKSVLGPEYNDNNWTSYDDLMKLATPEHIKIMQPLNGGDGQ